MSAIYTYKIIRINMHTVFIKKKKKTTRKKIKRRILNVEKFIKSLNCIKKKKKNCTRKILRQNFLILNIKNTVYVEKFVP